MARDSGGTYSLPAGYPLAYNLRPVPSSLLNSGYSDLAAEITDSLSRSGKGGMLANLSMGGFSITTAANGTFSGTVTAATLAGAGSGITALNAANLASGTIPDARFPATLPAISGANLTGLNAAALATGTVPDARFPATLPAISGSNLTNLNASALATGTVALLRLPSIPTSQITGLASIATSGSAADLAAGTIPAARFPAALPAIDGSALTNLNASALASGTVALLRLPAIPTTQITGLSAIATSGSAADLAAGTIPTARFPATLPALDGSALTNLNGSAIASGTVAVARLGTGTPTGSNFLRGDGTWQTISGTIPGGGTTAQFLRGDGTWSSTIVGTLTATTFSGAHSGDGSALTALNATQLTSGTVPDARFPATLPAVSGANLTSLSAAQLTSGTLADARFPATLPAISGANLTSLNAAQVTTGTLPIARLNGGTSAQFVRGDGAYSNTLLGDLVIGASGNTGAAGLSIASTLNLSFAEGSGVSFANMFRQANSAATILANGYKYSATANGFASSVGTSWAKSAIGLGVIAGGITFYTDGAAAVANGTDVTPSERMRLDATGLAISQGNSATQALNLYRGGSTAAYMAAGNSNTGLDGTWFGVDTAGNAVINQRAALAMIFSTNATERMRLDASGNLGIGTSSPANKLVVSNGSGENLEFFTGNVTLNGGGIEYINRTTATTRPDFNYYIGTTGAHKFFTNGTEKLRLDASGNLLLGATANPGVLNTSVVVDSGANSLGGVVIQNNATGRTFSDGGHLYLNGTELRLYNAENNILLFGTNNTERMRLDSGGLLGVGVTPGQVIDAYSAANGVIQVRGGSGVNQGGAFFVRNAANTSTFAAFGDRARAFGGTPDQTASIYTAGAPLTFDVNAATRMQIAAAGNVTINAPGSGTTLALTAIATGISMTATDGTRTFSLAHSGGAIQFGSSSNHDVNILSNNATRVVVGSAGNVAINAPSSGDHTVQHSVGGAQAIGYRGIPRSTTASTIALADRGQCVAVTAGITIPNATFAAGDAVSIYNDSASAVTITQGASLTLRQAGTTNTGNRTLAARGMATVWFNSASEAVISGSGLT